MCRLPVPCRGLDVWLVGTVVVELGVAQVLLRLSILAWILDYARATMQYGWDGVLFVVRVARCRAQRTEPTRVRHGAIHRRQHEADAERTSCSEVADTLSRSPHLTRHLHSSVQDPVHAGPTQCERESTPHQWAIKIVQCCPNQAIAGILQLTRAPCSAPRWTRVQLSINQPTFCPFSFDAELDFSTSDASPASPKARAMLARTPSLAVSRSYGAPCSSSLPAPMTRRSS